MKHLRSPAAPYSAKIRMAAVYADIGLDYEIVNTGADPSVLVAVNPLGKIPTLLLDDGEGVFDSRVIAQHLNRMSGNRLFPRNSAKRLEAEMLEALADGICDCLLTMVYERRARPEEKVHEPWVDRHWRKAERGLDALNANPPKLPKHIHVGHLATRAMIGYLDLRFAGKWEKGKGELRRWAARFDEKHPALSAVAPSDA